MKLEYLGSGSAHRPLIRLFDVASSDAARLRNLFSTLVNGSHTHIALHEEEGVEPVADCRLHLWVAGQNTGIVRDGPATFHCVLTRARWSEIASRCELFFESSTAPRQQSLNEDGFIRWLLSEHGNEPVSEREGCTTLGAIRTEVQS